MFEIGEKIWRGFQADAETHDAVIVRRAAGNAPDVVSDGETGDPGPAVAHLEETQRVDKVEYLLLRWARSKNNRENSGRAEEIALPEFVSGAGRQCWVQHAFDFRSRREPFGDGECGILDGGKTDGESLQAAKGETAVVGRNRAAEHLLRDAEALEDGGIFHGDGAEQDIAVAADVFSEGLERDVDAVVESVEENSGGPGVVQHDANIFCVSGGCDCGEVLHFHGERTRAFGPNEASVFLNQTGNAGADEWIIISGGDAEAGEELRGEFAIGVINAGGDEQVIAGLQQREIDERDGVLPTGSEDGVIAGFQFTDACGKFESGGRAVEAVRVANAVLIPGVFDDGGGGKDGGGTAKDRSGERLVAGRNFGVGVNELGLPGFGHADLAIWERGL